ncbi:MAG: class I SAM-dependent methyltransferase, partial [Pyrinomonadaceae bacterium]
MNSYQLNPYVQIVENHIFPGEIQYAIFHQLTGEVLEPSATVRSLLFALRLGSQFSFGEDELDRMGVDGRQLKELIQKEFVLIDVQDPLAKFLDQYVVRPIQNPALAYRSASGELMLVRTPMAQRIFSPGLGELPKVIEESLTPNAAALFLSADGTKTLAEIFQTMPAFRNTNPLTDPGFREAIAFLTAAHRQLIKFTRNLEDLGDPYRPCNIVPRNMYLPDRRLSTDSEDVFDFHLLGIEDASWEFDFVEPTINHGFRFPSEALGGLDYGGRFCRSVLRPEVLPLIDKKDCLETLEVGGGTGTFARSFIEQAQVWETKANQRVTVNYQIVDLAPALIHSQQQRLSSLTLSIQHFQQNATELSIPGRTFDLIIANEVIADFPVSSVNRVIDAEQNKSEWRGPGAAYLEKYSLAEQGVPDSFLLNTGAIQFLERAWTHLAPGGALIVTEYGSESTYPVQS